MSSVSLHLTWPLLWVHLPLFNHYRMARCHCEWWPADCQPAFEGAVHCLPGDIPAPRIGECGNIFCPARLYFQTAVHSRYSTPCGCMTVLLVSNFGFLHSHDLILLSQIPCIVLAMEWFCHLIQQQPTCCLLRRLKGTLFPYSVEWQLSQGLRTLIRLWWRA